MSFNARRTILEAMHLADMKSSVPTGEFCSKQAADMIICWRQHAGAAHVARTLDRTFAR